MMEKLLSWLLVLCLEISLSALHVHATGKLYVELEAYTNPHGKGDNGACCDGRGQLCEPHGCDHYFVICLDNYGGDNSINSCALHKSETATVDDRDSLLFARDAPHITNPIRIPFTRWRYQAMKIKVDVWDNDRRFNPDDLVERLRRQATLTAPLPRIYARKQKITLRGRTTLTLKMTVFCDEHWYGASCDRYCNANNQVRYSCDIHTGSQSCSSGWGGTDCNVKVDPCDSHPCINNATCHSNSTGYVCDCMLHFSGPRCEVNNVCDSNPCHGNGSVCTATTTGYTCQCSQMRTGVHCETELKCWGKPCLNNATCIEMGSGYICVCPGGFSGSTCQNDIDECTGNPCGINQTCMNVLGGFQCQNQTIKSTPMCKDMPCYENQTCRDLQKGYQCQNKKYAQECTMVNSYKCRYFSRSQNNTSNTTIDECQSISCLHNWTCIDLSNGFMCQKLDSPFQLHAKYCDLSPCLENQTCNDTIGYSCIDSINPITAAVNDCQWSSCLGDLLCQDLSDGYRCISVEDTTAMIEPQLPQQTTANLNDTFTNMTIPSDGNCSNHTCLNNGTCQIIDDESMCECSAEWQGKYCETRNPCFDEPCKNNGQCETLGEGFICHCASNFTGTLCETQIDYCDNQPCLNNASCHNVPNGYLCNCSEGWQGKQCNTSKVKTRRMYCYNGGSLVCNGTTCKCECPPHIRGRYCELRLSPCVRIPCANGGICYDHNWIYWCVCAKGFTGRHCLERVDKCANFSCQNNGTCVNTAAESAKSNTGTAKSAICRCPRGFTGLHCEVVVNTCSQHSCLNGGTCLNVIGGHFLCVCPVNYGGKLCQTHKEKEHDRKLTMFFDKKLNSEAVIGIHKALTNKLARTFYDPVTVELVEKVGTCQSLEGQTLYIYEFTAITNKTTLNSNAVMEITANYTYSWDLPQPLRNQMCSPEELQSMDNPNSSVEVWMKANWYILMLVATTVLIVIVVVVTVRVLGRMKPQNLNSTPRVQLEDQACKGTKFKAAEPEWCYDNKVYD